MRKILCLFLVLPLIFAVSGCGIMNWIFPDNEPELEEDDDDYIELPGDTEQPSSQDGRILYFADMHGNYVLPITYDIPWEEGIAKAVVSHLVEGGPAQQHVADNGLKAVLPANTEILGMTVGDDGNCTVDFSEEFLMTVDEVHERLMLDSLTFSLTEFPTIQQVTVWVNGQPLSTMPHGTPVDVLSRERGLNATGSSKGTGAAVTVYLGLDNLAAGMMLVPETRPVGAAAQMDAAIEQLIGGPVTDSSLVGVVPASTRVLSFETEGATAKVDFSSDLAEADNWDLAIAAVILTLTELPQIEDVLLTVEGQEVRLSDGSIMSEPVSRPVSANPLAF